MNNKLVGKVFAAILGTTIIFFGVAQSGDYLINEVIFPTSGFSDQTYIGPFDVSNLHEEEAAVTVSTGVQGWFDQAQVQIKLQDALVPFPLETVQFNTNDTLTSAQNGSKNGLEFDVTEEAVSTFLHQQFSPIVFSEEEVKSVTGAIRKQLASGRKDQIIDISSALMASSSVETVIATIAFDNVETTEGISVLMSALDGFTIEPKTTFSFLDFLETVDVGKVTESDLTNVASILYASVLHTNFDVVERSIGPTVPNSVPLGFEASINRNLGVDFVFTNQNTTSFTFNLNSIGTGINASLTGFPFVYSYEPIIDDKEEFSPKTIKQFSAFVDPNTIKVKTQGQNGVQVTVVKNIVSNGLILETKSIATDFYPPVHKVEVHPLISTATTGSGETGTDTTDGSNGTDGSTGSTDGTDGTSGQPSTDTSGNNGSSDNGDSTGTGSDPVSGGNSNTDGEGKEEPQYDKGGNLIPSSGK